MSSNILPFTHLHTHSHYSLLQALPQIPDLVKAAVDNGQKALALTDNGNLYAAIEFYKECKKQGIKPIIGADLWVAPRKMQDKEHGIDNNTSRLVLLAKNETGYKNLLKIVSSGFTEGFYYKPRVDRELLQKYKDGLVIILPSFGGIVAKSLKNNNKKQAEESLKWHRETFGEDLYLEVTMHDEAEGHKKNMERIVKLAREQNVQIVAAHDTYYLNSEDSLARELVVKIGTGGRLDREHSTNNIDFSFISQKRANELFKDLPEALKNTQKIADLCNVEFTLGKAIFPNFEIPKDTTYDKELRKMAEAGISKRKMKDSKELRERINYELDIISKKQYSGYFLIIADLINYARSANILTNTRGSAAGSLVSYLCGITTVDPIRFNMPFERFLSVDRPYAPDIDVDIADDRRDDLIDYVRKKYGEENVAQIGTFGAMMARAAVRDVARALGYSYGTGDQIAKAIPFGAQGFPMTIERALKESPELKEMYNDSADAREIIDLSKKIEGNARHIGVHAAGVVISPSAVTDFIPIQYDPKGGKIITQYNMYGIVDEYEGIGLVKFDFLGLKNLSVLADSVKRVKNRLKKEIDIIDPPLNDKKTYEMLSRGETLGVFQLASSGMTSYLKDLEPTVVDDLNAMVALYRPGPMEFIPEFIRRKKNPETVKYLDPRMEPILKPTYGILIYQDDIMSVAVNIAGYTWGESDKFRKAMGKKIPKLMAEQKDKFFNGCVRGGMTEYKAKELWEQIETFAAYGFNKAHSASYGNLAYKTAYMKANYPVDYMAALLTADAGDVDKISAIVAECNRINITVLGPDANESYSDFTVTNDTTIRFGLCSIKNFGEGISLSIVEERDKNGKFGNLADFLARIKNRNLNKKSLEVLIKSGALDSMGERGQMMEHIETLLQYHKEHMNAPENQNSLFGNVNVSTNQNKFDLPVSVPATQQTRLAWEKELLGLYISGHPLDAHKEKLEVQKFDIKTTKEELPNGIQTVIYGLIETNQTILTKNGEKMAFLKISDYRDSIEIVCFPRTFKEYEKIINPERCVAIQGRISERNGEKSFIAEKIKTL